jgi:hypothetical protein
MRQLFLFSLALSYCEQSELSEYFGRVLFKNVSEHLASAVLIHFLAAAADKRWTTQDIFY